MTAGTLVFTESSGWPYERYTRRVVSAKPRAMLWEGVGWRGPADREPHVLVECTMTGQRCWEPVRVLGVVR